LTFTKHSERTLFAIVGLGRWIWVIQRPEFKERPFGEKLLGDWLSTDFILSRELRPPPRRFLLLPSFHWEFSSRFHLSQSESIPPQRELEAQSDLQGREKLQWHLEIPSIVQASPDLHTTGWFLTCLTIFSLFPPFFVFQPEQ